MHDDLAQHIRSRLDYCRGDWIAKKSGYERSLCDALGIQLARTRYSDATWNGYSIELKKGTSIWLDLVRYAEVQLGLSKLDASKSVCLFCIPDDGKGILTNVFGVPMEHLLRKLALSTQHAQALIELRDHVPRQLNAQASLTVSDVKSIAAFSVSFLDTLL